MGTILAEFMINTVLPSGVLTKPCGHCFPRISILRQTDPPSKKSWSFRGSLSFNKDAELRRMANAVCVALDRVPFPSQVLVTARSGGSRFHKRFHALKTSRYPLWIGIGATSKAHSGKRTPWGPERIEPGRPDQTSNA